MMGATAVVERMTLTVPPQVPLYLAALARHTPVFVRAWAHARLSVTRPRLQRTVAWARALTHLGAGRHASRRATRDTRCRGHLRAVLER